MTENIFISYNHKQGDWVYDRLVPCLKAAGVEVLLDKERFRLGKGVVGQMDDWQDKADKNVLVLSEDYLNSKYCQHELHRALGNDPKFAKGLVLPLLREKCVLPKQFTGWNPPLYADFQNDKTPESWEALLEACGANQLGTGALDWLGARDELVRHLRRNKSVNLLVQGKPNWQGLLDHIINDHFPRIARVNLENPKTITRKGLLTTILRCMDQRIVIPDPPEDLPLFTEFIDRRPMTQIVLTHFDLVNLRNDFNIDFFAALRYAIMDLRKLTLLIQSRVPFANLLPQDHPLSSIDVTTVELTGIPCTSNL